MAYTNEEANELVELIHEKQAHSLTDAISIAWALTLDRDILGNLPETNLRPLAESAEKLGERLLDFAQDINESL